MTTNTVSRTECIFQQQDPPSAILPPLPQTSASPKPTPAPEKNDGKFRIILKTPQPIKLINNGHLITTFHDKSDFPKIDLGELLLRLGQRVIRGDQCDKWLSMVQVALLCRRYQLKWQGGSIKARHLEQCTRDYLEKHADIMGGGVKVECKTEFNQDQRRQVLFLKFRRLFPDGSTN